MYGWGVKISGMAEKSTMDTFLRDVSGSYRSRRSLRAEGSSAETDRHLLVYLRKSEDGSHKLWGVRREQKGS